jgi:hypothetical protein
VNEQGAQGGDGQRQGDVAPIAQGQQGQRVHTLNTRLPDRGGLVCR